MNPVSLIAMATMLAAASGAVLLVLILVQDHVVARKPISIDLLCKQVGPFVVLATVAVAVTQALYRPYSLWDDPRLALTMAIFHGHRLYAPPDEGARKPGAPAAGRGPPAGSARACR